ncbi:zinc finger protein 525-like [Branchiostoma floridae]|uniref:Zinc finger protein 525-like n=1 Tax=Branchiostoma floridae TaxID=7739 RepID=A0A9J7KLA2_BRAFL|nr:zinc finger protein 525-like [Branchiostoma floridae]
MATVERQAPNESNVGSPTVVSPVASGSKRSDAEDVMAAEKVNLNNVGEKPYMCGQFGHKASYSCRRYLYRHMITHTGENVYKCDQFDDSTTKKSTFENHFTRHSGEKLYMCEECGRTYAGEHPYKCGQSD